MTRTRIALTRDVSPRLAECELTHLARTPIDVQAARLQHAAYERALVALGCEVRRVAPAPEHPDSVFIEDAAVVFDEIAVITRPGAAARRAETVAVAEQLGGLRPLARIVEPGTLDGGDVLTVGRRVFVGRTDRTNAAGIAQLASALAPHGYAVQAVEVTGCLHLKSAVTALDDATVLLNPAWVDAAAFAPLTTVEVDPAEPMAANVLRVGDALLYADAYPRTRGRIEARGHRPTLVDASELAKAEGAVTCCSLILRALALLACCLMPTPMLAQDVSVPDSVLMASRLPAGSSRPTIDGHLDDAVWRSARPISDLRQREPESGAPATERTEVRVLFDEATLFVAVHAIDREPAKVVARILERDRVMNAGFDGSAEFGGDDAVAILIDGFHDHRNAMVFATNANGAEFDAMLTDEGREFNVDWRGIWRVAATRTPDGWSAEFAIPFRSLRYRSGSAVWGINVYRMIRRKNEEVLWKGWTRSGGGFSRVSLAGHLGGLDSLPRPRRSFEVRPYVLLGNDRERDDVTGAFEDARRTGIGGEIKAQVGSGLVLDATVNTDFAQVEADNVQVNLSRFSLFFPEKREFFLENAGIFEFGARSRFEPPAYLLFFSRQIGIADDGPVPVLGGGRLTGRVGGQTVGLLSIVTDSAFDQGRTAFNVVRVKRDIGGNNYIGAMATDRRMGDEYNTAGGLDFSLWPTQTLNLQGFAAQTTTGGPGGDGGAQRIAVNLQTGRLGFDLQHLRVDAGADAQLGFVSRTDIQRTGGSSRLTVRPGRVGVRSVSWLVFGDYTARIDGGLQDQSIANAINLDWESGMSSTYYHGEGTTRLDESFDIADSLPVPVGSYLSNVDGFFTTSNPARPIIVAANGERTTTYGGVLTRLSTELTARLGRHLGLALGTTRNWVAVPSGGLLADIVSARLNWALSTQVFVSTLVQYNGLDERVSANARLQYIFRPGSDLFLVLNDERGDGTTLSRLESRGLRLKVAYLRRL